MDAAVAAGMGRNLLDDDDQRPGAGISATGSDEDGGADLRRGPWTVDEDVLLVDYVANHGEGRWNSLARSAGLKRTGKSCRLRWLNYLRPDVRRGNITPEEQLTILELHSRWGNRWSRIARHLPGRTDNEVKNYWRTRVQKHARRLRCDVNGQRFRDVVRRVWMPRLVERIRAGAGGGANDDHAAATTTRTVMSAPAACQLTSAYDSHHYYCYNNNMDYYNEPSQTATAMTMSPEDTSSLLRSSSLTTEASSSSSHARNLASTPTTNEGGGAATVVVQQQRGGATTTATGPVDGGDHHVVLVRDEDMNSMFGGSWSELLRLATVGRHDGDSMTTPDFAQLGDSENNLWSLEDLWLHQQCS